MKHRPAFDQLEQLCQKPDHRHVGNWMARHVSRPVALRITWLVAPWGISANMATVAAWTLGVAGAGALAWGTLGGWILGAALLQVWYLLDHVDGQLARLRGTASLDGTQLDYLMHHTINLLVPLGIGVGLATESIEPLWAMAGLAWGVSLLLITLQHDARYKAFNKRLKRVRGQLVVKGGGGGRPIAQPPVPHHPLRLAAWLARKGCEPHVVTNVLAAVAIVQLLCADESLRTAKICVVVFAPIAMAVTAWTILRSLKDNAAEQEFSAWYRPLPGHDLTFENGWWVVENRRRPATSTREQE